MDLSISSICVPLWIRLLPFHGNSYVKKKLDLILTSRNRKEFEEAWNKFGFPNDFLYKLFGIIKNHCGWNNTFFMPEDECSAIFLENDLSLESAETILVILEKFFETQENDNEIWNPIINNQKFYVFVDYLVKNGCDSRKV